MTYSSVLGAALSSVAEKSMHLFRFVCFFTPSEFDLGKAGERETRFLLRHHVVLYEHRFIYCCCSGIFQKTSSDAATTTSSPVDKSVADPRQLVMVMCHLRGQSGLAVGQTRPESLLCDATSVCC